METPALRTQGQESYKFEASLDYVEVPGSPELYSKIVSKKANGSKIKAVGDEPYTSLMYTGLELRT